MTYMPVFIKAAESRRLVFTIREASSAGERRQCVRLAWNVYRGDRYWLPPLIGPRLSALKSTGAERGLFFAEARNIGLGEEVVGTVAVWADPARGEAPGNAVACFGLFETINDQDVADTLFEAAEVWALEHIPGVTALRGPFSLDRLGAPGLLVDGFNVPAAAFLPYNLPYYPELIELAGYRPVQEEITWILDLPPASAVAPRHIGESLPAESGVQLRQVSPAELPGATAILAELYAAADAPVRLADFVAGCARGRAGGGDSDMMRPLFDCGLAVLAEAGGRPVAAAVALPDVAAGLRGANGRLIPFGWLPWRLAVRRATGLRALSPAVLPAWRGSGVDGDVYRALGRAAAEAGYRRIEAGPLPAWAVASVRALRDLGARPARGFRLYEKCFA